MLRRASNRGSDRCAEGSLWSPLEADSDWLQEIAATSREPDATGFATGMALCERRYIVETEVGRGGMGIVYAVWDRQQRDRAALKTFTRSSPSAIYRIKQEFRGLSDVVHPNLVRLYELFQHRDRWCFTLELVPGKTLLRALAGVPADTLRAALRQLAEGIQALHAAGKLHRDLKPSNVMLTPAGRVVILDFGLAEDIHGVTPGESKAGTLSGTPEYMAPELYARGRASQASDWYSFGVILCELLTGRLPEETGLTLTTEQPELMPGLDPALVADLLGLCRGLLSPDPDDRPRAGDVLRCLTRAPIVSARGREPARPPSLRFLGRAPELALLRETFAACRAGARPSVVLLSGASGIGKTALVRAFLGELAGAVLLRGRCYEREFVPYKAFDAVIDDLCRHLGGLSPEELAAALPVDFPALCRLFPVLGRVRPSAIDGELGGESDEHELRRRGFEALGALLDRLRRDHPVVLWIDDLQWTDADSTRLLLHLLRQPAAPQLLLIASHRSDPEERHPLLRALYDALAHEVRLDVKTLELGPLSPEDARELLESVSPGAPRTVIERAQGHPFLLEELARYAAREMPEHDRWPSLEDAIGARLETLPDEERTLLELVALAGRPLSEELACAASGGLDGHTAARALCALRLARRDAVNGRLSCYHDAIRQVVIGAVPPPRARQRHRRLARAMLRALHREPEHLGFHLAGCGHGQRAAEQMIVAAARAASALAFERAAQLYQSALEHGRFDRVNARALSLARAHALAAAGHGSAAAELYVAAADDADASEVIELRTRAAEQYLLSGHLEQGLALLRSAFRRSGLRLHTTAAGTIASFVYHRARLQLRGHGFQPRPVPRATAQRLALIRRAGVALNRLDPLRAGELAARMLLLALESGSASAIATARVGDLLVGALFRVSEAELARRLARAERACDEFGGPEERAHLHGTMAAVARLKPQPDLPAALYHLDRFLQIHREHVLPRTSYERPWAEWDRAMVQCMQGELGYVARQVPLRLEEGWARGDHCIVPLWAGGEPLLARVATGDLAGAEHDLLRAARDWSSRSFTLQDLMLALGAFRLACYRSDAREAWQIAEAARRRLATSPLRRMPNAVDVIEATRAYAALELAARETSASQRRELHALAQSLRRTRRRPNLAAIVRGQLLDAACHHQCGRLESAVAALDSAEPMLEAVPLFAHAVRYRRGQLVGGEEGAASAAHARKFFVERGVIDPERLIDTLLPGYAARD